MIPEIAKQEFIRKRQAGQTWTSMARWLADEYGVELHRSTIQRWYDREVVDLDMDMILDEAAANMADTIAPEEEEDLLKDRIRLDKRLVTFKSEATYYKKLYEWGIATCVHKFLAICNASLSFSVSG